MTEIWKEIEGFPAYKVSNLGNVWSNSREKVMSCGVKSSGYRSVALYRNGKPIDKLVHRLVAQAFVPGRVGATVVNHIDGDKLNNAAQNLEWVTAQENTLHAVKSGLHPQGEGHGNAKLSFSDIAEIRRLGALGELQRIIAKRFGVCKATISEILRGHIWKVA